MQRYVVPTEEFRRGDFSAAPTKVYDPATGDAAGVGRTQFASNQIPSNRISPIALTSCRRSRRRTCPGVALGLANYQVNTYRDKTTDSFDTKLNYALNDSNQLSGRFSYQKPTIVQLPAEGYGDYGGPLGSGFMATGTNETYSAGVNWTHTFSNTFVMEARGGTSYYRNEALTTANGQNLAEAAGHQGRQPRRLDQWTVDDQYRQRLQQPGHGVYRQPAVGSLGTDVAVRGDRHQGVEQPHDQVRRRLAQQQRPAPPDPGSARARAGISGSAAHRRVRRPTPPPTAGLPTPSRPSCSMRPSSVQRDLKVLDDVGTRHWAVFGFVHDKWQASSKLTIDLGLRWEYYDPLVGLAGRGSLSNFDPATNSLLVAGYGSSRTTSG